jgi:hypothetical protein
MKPHELKNRNKTRLKKGEAEGDKKQIDFFIQNFIIILNE